MERKIRKTFATFRIGLDVRSNGTSVTGIVADYFIPTEPMVEGKETAIVPTGTVDGYRFVTVVGPRPHLR